MYYLFGILVSLASVVFSIFHLRQSVDVYADLIATAVVICGTIAVGVMTFPWEYRDELRLRIRDLLFGRPRDPRALALEALTLVRSARAEHGRRAIVYPGLAGSVLRDGAEMIDLGFAPPKIQLILEERIHQAIEDAQKVANAFRSLAKYPPAFGLIGTVLSLVSVMRAVASGGNAQETGMRIAVALISTFYGLLLANLLVSPAGESILKSSLEDKKEAELALQAVLLAAEGESLLEAQETINSFVPERHRINLMRIEAGATQAAQPSSAPPEPKSDTEVRAA
jgi:chemotaxis protein MotA